ncbi:MAG TPA: preprotein translocase subunit SecY [Fimbriimonadaceae bacterium]|nr:preprotein translocase subunit SecY [Fimbriimonadaceae bacterium]
MSLGGGTDVRGLKLSLGDTFRLAWADPDLRSRLMFVLGIFLIYTLGIQIRIPVPGFNPDALASLLKDSPFFQLIGVMGGGAIKRLSVFALGLGPYISASIIMQVLTMTTPSWKKEMQEGGEYARKQQNRRTRWLTVALCVMQSLAFLQYMGPGVTGALTVFDKASITVFWTAGAMFLLWLGEQVSERGIGNGVSLLIFAGIAISLPSVVMQVFDSVQTGVASWFQVGVVMILFLAVTWFIVLFTISQRRIPVQHMRRNFGTQAMGGRTSYLPISVNMAGVIPIIFAIALVYMPAQLKILFPSGSDMFLFFDRISRFFYPDFTSWQGWIGALVYMALIFFFTYFWNAMMYNVEDIADNLKKSGSYIPGVRPGKQTKDFLDRVVSNVTFVGALFLSIAALTQFIFPVIVNVRNLGLIGGTSLLILVAVALETMRQIEASILIRQYES